MKCAKHVFALCLSRVDRVHKSLFYNDLPSVRAGDGRGGRGSERLFGWCDAYLAGVLASLRRQGVSLSMLARVSRLLEANREAEVAVT
jgi:hypothetical protein